jgi:hypothetical protein
VKVYKFLARGGVGPLSGFVWPTPREDRPGEWVQAPGPLALCERGAHVCRPSDLAYWIHDELWQVEADGEQLEGPECVVVQRARLVRRIDAWHEGGARRFAEICVQHAAQQTGDAPSRAYLDDAAEAGRLGYPAISAFAAALAVARAGSPAEEVASYHRERAWQGEWIVDALIAAAP